MIDYTLFLPVCLGVYLKSNAVQLLILRGVIFFPRSAFFSTDKY